MVLEAKKKFYRSSAVKQGLSFFQRFDVTQKQQNVSYQHHLLE
jgi:hypothetical protein